MAFQFFRSDSIIDEWLLLSKHYSLYEFLALFHQTVRKKRTVDSVDAPATYSVTHSHSNIGYERSIFAGASRYFRNWIRVADKNELFFSSYILSTKMLSRCDSLDRVLIIFVTRSHRAQLNISVVLGRIVTLNTGVAIVDAILMLAHISLKISPISSVLVLSACCIFRWGNIGCWLITRLLRGMPFRSILYWFPERGLKNHRFSLCHILGFHCLSRDDNLLFY